MIATGLRLPPALHAKMTEAAKDEGRSLNAQIIKLCEAYTDSRERSARARKATTKADTQPPTEKDEG